MRIENDAIAGTLESSDAQVRVTPHQDLDVVVNSSVEAQFGDAIRALVAETLAELGVTAGRIQIDDKGALDCTLRARLIGAITRSGDNSIDWGTL